MNSEEIKNHTQEYLQNGGIIKHYDERGILTHVTMVVNGVETKMTKKQYLDHLCS